MKFTNENIGLSVVLSQRVISHLESQKQRWPLARESGGQLFGEIDGRVWSVQYATGPRPTDRRGPFHYIPDVAAEADEIDQYEGLGMTFLGDWHSHYQQVPYPSPRDFQSTEGCLADSVTALPGFLLLVVGRCFPQRACSTHLVSSKARIELSSTSTPEYKDSRL